MAIWVPVPRQTRRARAVENAREACRELARSRREREEVAAYLATELAARLPAPLVAEA